MSNALLRPAMLQEQPNDGPLVRFPLAPLTEHHVQAKLCRPVPAKRAAIYAYIVKCVMERGRAPTIRQIGEAFAMRSTGNVVYYVDWLYEQGLITQRKTCRSITVCGFRDWPVLGTVVQGVPRSHLGIIEAGLVEPCSGYVLRVADDALSALHYCAGDALIVEPVPSFMRPGALVVARRAEPEGTATLLLAHMGDDGQLGSIATQPPIAPCELSETCVQGIVTGMVRLYR